ncbi:MAG TPA: adenylosuccinate synthetase [Anaerolineaceae bacterium]|nr:adenylosuccinate synthetase [Anaerolineaceae bacterium]
MRATIVIDLGFGDAGKGLITDFLVRQTRAGVVVRYNGGAQAGHNVVTPEGVHHTFSQFGSGSFVTGVKTYLSKHMVVHPGALLLEGDVLVKKGISDIYSRIKIDPQALIITPYHQAANRIKELSRESGRHGSCGVGVGETVEDDLAGHEDCIRAGDLADPNLLLQKMDSIRTRKQKELLDALGHDLSSLPTTSEWQVFQQNDLAVRWMDSIRRIIELDLVDQTDSLSEWSKGTESIVFEGAQGVLLDANAGFFPYNSWTNCSPDNAIALVHEHAPSFEIIKIGVSRCFTVRHGPGPLPTETRELDGIVKEHNQSNDWQGSVRYGWFDQVLFNYALNAVNGVDLVAVTHLDILNKLDEWKICGHYPTDNILETNLATYPSLSLAQKESVTRQLMAAKPDYESFASKESEILRAIERASGMPISIAARGSNSQHVTILESNAI